MKLILFVLIIVISLGLQAGEECPTGQVFSDSLNRCILSQSTVDNKKEASRCEGLEGDAYKKCFSTNVENDLADAERKGDIKGYEKPEAKYGIPAIATLGAGTILLTQKDALQECGQTSMWLMVGGGASSLLGEFMAQKKYNKAVDELAQKYQERIVDKPIDDEESIKAIDTNQKIAFDFQIEQELAREDAHSARAKAYKLAFGLYTASVVASLYDAWLNQGKGCEGSTSFDFGGGAPTTFFNDFNIKPTTNKFVYTKELIILNKELFGEYYFLESLSYSEITEIVQRKVFGVFMPLTAVAEERVMEEVVVTAERPPQDAQTDTQDPGVETNITPILGSLSTLKEGTKTAGKSMKSTVGDAVKSPYIRAAVGGLLAMYSKKVADKASEHADESKERVRLLKKLKEDFVATGGAGFDPCKDKDRNNPGKPSCFCYTKERQPNTTRLANEICKPYFERGGYGNSGLYGSTYASSSGLRGCISKGEPDPDCTCKDKKNSNGNDTCENIRAKLTLGRLQSVKGLPSMINDTVKFTEGNITTGQLNSGATEQLAVKMNQIKKNLAKKPEFKKTIQKLDQASLKLRKGIARKISRGLASGEIKNPFKSSLSSAPTKVNAKSLLKNMKKEIKANQAKRVRGKDLAKKKKSGFDFNFDEGSVGQGSISVDHSKDIMKKNFAFNDINENSSNNIFQIITNRYQRSGFRRLFDDKEISRADAPSGTEINSK